MSKQVKCLTWEDGRYSTLDGKAGPGKGVRLFTISWHSRRADPNWLMHCDLPGFADKEWKNDDKEALQATAEAVLATWLELIGVSRERP